MFSPGLEHKKFYLYLYGKELTINPLFTLTNLSSLMTGFCAGLCSSRTMMFKIKAIKGRDNVGADYLSRVN